MVCVGLNNDIIARPRGGKGIEKMNNATPFAIPLETLVQHPAKKLKVDYLPNPNQPTQYIRVIHLGPTNSSPTATENSPQVNHPVNTCNVIPNLQPTPDLPSEILPSEDNEMAPKNKDKNKKNKDPKKEGNNNKGGKTDPAKDQGGKGNKVGNTGVELTNENAEVNVTPPSPPLKSQLSETLAPIADVVIDHFSSRWDDFKDGFKSDLSKLSFTVNDKAEGLVTRVENLEATVNGKQGGKSLVQQISDLSSRVTSVEQSPATPTASTQVRSKSLDARVTKLEKECITEDNGLNLSIKNIRADIATLRADLDKIADFSKQDPIIKTSDMGDVKADVYYALRDLETVSGEVHVLGNKVRSIQHRSTMNAAKLMHNQLIFGGVKNRHGAPAEMALKTFLKNIMKLVPDEEDILEAEALGSGYKKRIWNRDIHFPPPIRAKCSEYFAQKVMRNAFKLAGKKDQEQGYKYFVKRARPEAHRAVQDHFAKDIRQFKIANKKKSNEADKTQYKFDGTDFVVNGEIVQQDIHPPTFRDMLLIPQETQRKLDDIETWDSPHLERMESWFQAFAIKAYTLEAVELGYMKVKQSKRFADHIMVAYRIKVNDTRIQEGCTDDGEYYGDQEMLKVMKIANVVNTAVFVAREYGGHHIGKDRFKIIAEVTTKALQEMEPETYSIPSQQTRPKGQRGHRPRCRCGGGNQHSTPCPHSPTPTLSPQQSIQGSRGPSSSSSSSSHAPSSTRSVPPSPEDWEGSGHTSEAEADGDTSADEESNND